MACSLKEACFRDRVVQFEGCVAVRTGRIGDKQRIALKLFIEVTTKYREGGCVLTETS